MKVIIIIVFALSSSAVFADTWVTEDVDVAAGESFACPSMEIQDGNIYHIAYQQHLIYNHSELKYACRDGSTWSTTTVCSDPASYHLALYLSLALDNSDNPSIAYSDNKSGTLQYTAWTGTGWSSELVDNTEPGYGEVSLCMDPVSNTPAIAYNLGYGNSDYDVMFASYNNLWETSPVDTLGNLGYCVSMAIAGDGTRYVAYFDGNNSSLKCAVFQGNSWEAYTIDNDDVVGLYNSIDLDSSGNPHISYFDFYNGALKYARYTGSDWVTETVASGGNSGILCTSIALDSNERPHISYYHETHDCLMHAWYNGAQWIQTVVDEDDSAGKSSSITIDSNDIPHIAYTLSDGENMILRHACLTPEGIEGENQAEAISLNILPNPCSGSATVSFNLSVSDQITLSLYDVSGRKIATIAEGTFSEASHSLTVNNLTPGIYVCSLQSGGLTAAETMVVLE